MSYHSGLPTGGAVQWTFAALSLPGAYFASMDAIKTFKEERIAYENIIAEYEKFGDRDGLVVELQALGGIDEDDIQRHLANPGWRIEMLYVTAESLVE